MATEVIPAPQSQLTNGRGEFQESVTNQQDGKVMVALPGIEPGFED